ncbi:MAG: hypothetical protein ACE5MG_13550 [Candidatus Methylomirabilales bacterium]
MYTLELFRRGISIWTPLVLDLFEASVTTGTVSKAVAVLNTGLQVYHTKPLSDDAAFLSWERIAQKVREQGTEGN